MQAPITSMLPLAKSAIAESGRFAIAPFGQPNKQSNFYISFKQRMITMLKKT
ncbi:hypothetical protein [Komarekiella delphini-convector]|uniref:hypothetical protein n=1 Tax=Komarekiella delphini-convector TaxID=3050158 RepID=UPI00178054EB|nr:hypothetical protein [Komarekiella delphini-convector]